MLEDIVVVTVRIVTFIPIVIFLAILMGKRAVSEMPVFDFLILMILASLVGADLGNPDIHHAPTVAAVIAIFLLQRAVSSWAIRFRRFGKLITFEPTLVVENGKLLAQNIRSIKYSVDNVLQLLREKGVFNVDDVSLAIIEASGELSVLKKPAKDTPTNELVATSIPRKASIAYPLIIDGIISKDMLTHVGLTEEALRAHLEAKGVIRLEDVFLCTINQQGDILLSYSFEKPEPSPVEH
ncbi:DUF421 domain-containing protein [Shouchella lonarensis]|uniref:Uncharacterized membrane protein YcaP, DUF421 family n=1 Tax=Shouchella lonarensis TaxID=1464122 RepID=A0A1G6LDE6_9BACI|nr:DUF421 domain-containing protein [Shouchella lonarensis]SDC41213.1 Uncharacterized membrane protein YcaP, DUF421 family [Shouchella lonarensis]